MTTHAAQRARLRTPTARNVSWGISKKKGSSRPAQALVRVILATTYINRSAEWNPVAITSALRVRFTTLSAPMIRTPGSNG